MCTIMESVILGFTMVCGLFDLKFREIPVWLMLLFSVITSLGTMFWGKAGAWSSFAGLMIGVLFLILSRLTKEAIGYGDSWIIALLGIYLGAEKILWALFIASFLAAIAALFQMWKQNWNRKGTLPFVPFLTLGAAGVIFL